MLIWKTLNEWVNIYNDNLFAHSYMALNISIYYKEHGSKHSNYYK